MLLKILVHLIEFLLDDVGIVIPNLEIVETQERWSKISKITSSLNDNVRIETYLSYEQ